ncbi:MAG: hypothetical protein DSZ24_01065 [Thermodesulfatator sp.]|nr:MAG: hypothetical protein DSZ24_01065 [Thermodesulfatator sp.]
MRARGSKPQQRRDLLRGVFLSLGLHLLLLGLLARGLASKPERKWVKVHIARLEIKSPGPSGPSPSPHPALPPKKTPSKAKKARASPKKTSRSSSKSLRKRRSHTEKKSPSRWRKPKGNENLSRITRASKISGKEEELLEERISELALRERLAELQRKVSARASGGGGEGGIPEGWKARLTAHLESFWEVPTSLAGRRDLSALVILRLSATGELLGYRFLHPSGNPLFDRAVEAALKAAAPYPPPGRPLKVRVLFRPEGLS